MTHTMMVIIIATYEQQYIHICTHSCGIPCPLVNHVIRLRIAENKTANVGA